MADKPALLDAFRAPGPPYEASGTWASAHNLALSEPSGPDERMAVHLLKTVATFHARLRDDSVGAPQVVAPLLKAADGLLDFELGRLDGGTLDRALRSLAESAGLDRDSLEPRQVPA